MTSVLTISLFSFLAATSLIIMVTLLITASQSSPKARIRRRLTEIGKNPYASKEEVRSLLKGQLYSNIPWLNLLLSNIEMGQRIDVLLERANLDFTVSLFMLLCVCSGAIVYLILTLLNQVLFVALLGGLMALSFPYLYAMYLARKRLRRFLEQLPEGLDMMAQGLQAGMGLTQSLTYMCKEMPDPLGTEFSIFMEEMNLGLPIADALMAFQRRIPFQEMRLLSTALMVNREVGGSLAELLNRLSDVIRERFRIERQIKTLTAQNRLSAWVVCSLPPLLSIFMFFVGPDAFGQMMAEPLGQMMLISALVLEVIGIFAFRKLIRIDF
jgi:tight adherence protein B